jgi:hypothetical protein
MLAKDSHDTMPAWNWIITNWGTAEWKPIPAWVRQSLGFRSDVGVYSFNIITRKSATYSAEVVAHLNRDRNIKV